MSGELRNEHTVSTALFNLLLLTIPPVLLYFAGWAYLHFYLRAFGVSLSELDLDVQTIFIYSVPVIRALIGATMTWIAALVIALVFLLGIVFLPPRPWSGAMERIVRGARGWALAIVVFLIVPLVAAWSIPYIRGTAYEAADRKWVSQGVPINVLVHTGKERQQVEWIANYQQCGKRRGLDLVFSDKAAYYILCVSTLDKRSAVVYEFRRDVGLVSVRFTSRDL